MAFKLKSGNKPLFKKIGASPLKQEKPIPHPETIIDEVEVEDKYKRKKYGKELPEVVVEDKKPKKEVKKKEPKKDGKKDKKEDEKKDKLTAALEKQNQLNRRKERREKREKYRKKTKSIINLLDKPGL